MADTLVNKTASTLFSQNLAMPTQTRKQHLHLTLPFVCKTGHYT